MLFALSIAATSTDDVEHGWVVPGWKSPKAVGTTTLGGTTKALALGGGALAADGGVFAFGDARFLGSMAGQRLNRPIVGVSAAPSGTGYWLVASDGGVFAFGAAAFYGGAAGITLRRPVTALVPRSDGSYWLIARDGGVFSFGTAPFFGSAAGSGRTVVAAIRPRSDGYRLVFSDASVASYGTNDDFSCGNMAFSTSAPLTAALDQTLGPPVQPA